MRMTFEPQTYQTCAQPHQDPDSEQCSRVGRNEDAFLQSNTARDGRTSTHRIAKSNACFSQPRRHTTTNDSRHQRRAQKQRSPLSRAQNTCFRESGSACSGHQHRSGSPGADRTATVTGIDSGGATETSGVYNISSNVEFDFASVLYTRRLGSMMK